MRVPYLHQMHIFSLPRKKKRRELIMEQKLQNVSIPSSNSTNIIQHKLQSIIQNQYQQHHNNWAYAIFWNLTTTHHTSLQPLLTWGAAHFQSHQHLQPSTARDFPAPEGTVLCNAIRSNEVVWLNNNRRREQAQSFGIHTLVCIPTRSGVIELGSPDVITRDSNLVEQVNAEFRFNSTDIKYAKALRQEELINRRYSSLCSCINELLMRIEELESQAVREASEGSEETEASSREEWRVVEVEVKMIGEDEAVIRVESRNLSYAGARLMDALRDLGLKVQHGSMSNLKDSVTVQDMVVQVPTGFGFNHEAIKQALVTILHH